MKKALILLSSFLYVSIVFADSFETLSESLTIKSYKSYSATIKNSSTKELLGTLSVSDANDPVNYIYRDAKDQKKITFTIEQHFGEFDAFLFQIFDENQILIGRLSISNPSNMFFKGFELYGPDADISQILNRQVNPLIAEPAEIFSNNFNVYDNEKHLLATLSGRSGPVEVKLNKDNLANLVFITKNLQNTDLLLAIFAMQSLKSIQKVI